MPILLPDRTATGVAEALGVNIPYKFGMPTKLTSDSAPEFISKVIASFAKIHDIKLQHTFGYHPEGNSVVERIHLFLGACLRRLTDVQYSQIERYLPMIAWAHNVRLYERTKMAPYTHMHGRPPVTLISSLGL